MGKVGDKALADRLGMAPGAISLARSATLQQHRIQPIEARSDGNGRHEVRRRVLHQPLDFPLIV